MSTLVKPSARWNEVLQIAWRLLTFRASRAELQKIETDWRFLVFGLICTWLAGIGRWWDDPQAEPLQQTGLGSVAYVFALALFLWLFILPLKPAHWSYRGILTFITLTSPLAFLYALPVERWMGNETAIELNLIFLAVVATWRVALLIYYFVTFVRLGAFATVVATFLPLSVIITVLGFLSMASRVASTMGGLREEGAEDATVRIVETLSGITFIALFPLVIFYVFLWAQPRHDEL